MTGPSLEFTKERPTQTWQAIGLLTDEKGNTFRVFVSGATEESVRNFIEYQNQQSAAGKPGISVSVTKLKKGQRRRRSLKAGDASPGLPADAGANLIGQATWGGVLIGISRLKMVTRGNCRITYRIDPPISPPPPGVSDVEREKSIFKTEFDDPEAADVRCTATQGKVKAELLETVPRGQPIRHEADATVDSPAVFHQSSQATGKWTVRVTGLAADSYFTLEWDRVVS